MKLSQRKNDILIAIVEDYIKDASPITSGVVKERHLPNVSSATLRAELNALEAMGFLRQLHTSGGRVPTTEGYRYYVEFLLKDFKLEASKIERVSEILNERTKSVNEIVSELAKIISEATNYPTVIMMNGYDNFVIENIKIISLINDSAIILIETKNGIINCGIKTCANQKACEDAGRILTKKFFGLTIGQMLENISDVEKEINKEIEDYNLLAQGLLEGFRQLANTRPLGIKTSTKLLDSGEEKTVKAFKNTLEILDDEQQLEVFLKTEEEDLSFDLTDEDDEFSGLAVVKAPLILSGKQVGTIGVFGPQRMDYSTIASALKFLTNEMENLDKLEDK